jgi:tRNA-splicing ligase RtcB
MRAKDLIDLGVPAGAPLKLAQQTLARAAAAGLGREQLRARLHEVVARPQEELEDELWGELATTLSNHQASDTRFVAREEPAPFVTWGEDLDPDSLVQMEQACQLPIACRGALMPDAHLGYGLPIGGVLAAYNAVIPYAVGMDIACRMKLSVLELPPATLEDDPDLLVQALEKETSFGIGATFRRRRQHAVMDEDWQVTPVTRQLKDQAWAQLGTSGSGNHFVEYGLLSLEEADLGLEPGTYLALLSHSGSRGSGAKVAGHYSKLALSLHPELPREMQRLAWFELDSAEGQEYWQAMQLMGRYAAANHDLIHRHVVRALGCQVLADIENHHNFAWLEEHDGEQVVVHRKGATPAGKGVLGIIPGSMATAAYVVRGKGEQRSLRSASHGAGRRMSRTQAKSRFSWDDLQRFLDERGVRVLSAGIDECPMAYKDIEEVMAAQQELVEPVARFEPKLVRMAPAGERPED